MRSTLSKSFVVVEKIWKREVLLKHLCFIVYRRPFSNESILIHLFINGWSPVQQCNTHFNLNN